MLRGKETSGPPEAGVVDVGNDEFAGGGVAVEGEVDAAEAHGSGTGENGRAAPGANAHSVLVGALGNVVAGPKGPDDAAHGFGKTAEVVGFLVILQKTVHLHHFRGNHDVGGRPADPAVAVARGIEAALVVEGRLDGELLALGVASGPF